MSNLVAKNDLLLRAARRLPVERVPVWMMRQAGRSDPAYRALREKINLPLEQLFRTVPKPFSPQEVEWAIEISLLPKRIGVDAIIVYQDILTPLAPMGVHFRFDPGPILETPIRTREQVEALHPLNDPSSQMAFNGQVIRGLRQRLDGELPLIGFAGAPMTLALFMIAGRSPMIKEGGISQEAQVAFQMMREEPDLIHELLKRLTRLTIDYLNYQISEGIQVVQLFESVADQMTRPLYETFVQPSLGIGNGYIGMAMNIDEAWRHDEPFGVDDAVRARAVESTDSNDATVLDSHVLREPRIAGAIENTASANQDVVMWLSNGGAESGENENN